MTDNNPTSFTNEPYCRCCSCGRILPETDWNGYSDDTRSPCCGSSGISRELWPTPAAQKLIEITMQNDFDSPARLQTTAVFLCFAAELMLENIIVNYLKASKNTAELSLFGQVKSLGDLISIFDRVTGESIAGKLEVLGAAGFMEDLRRLEDFRGKLAIDREYQAQQADKNAVVSVRDGCKKYFAQLNNSLCQNGLQDAGQKARSVLIVDDELAVMDFMCKILQRQGFNVFKASSGAEAIDLFKKNAPDCVLLDMSLPDMDGLSVLREIKGINPSAVVHMVTGIGGDVIEKQAKKLGTNSYISKPIDAKILVDIVKNI